MNFEAQPWIAGSRFSAALGMYIPGIYYFFLAVFRDLGGLSSTFGHFLSFSVDVFLLGKSERFPFFFLGPGWGWCFAYFRPADPPAQCRGWSG